MYIKAISRQLFMPSVVMQGILSLPLQADWPGITSLVFFNEYPLK